MSGGVVLGKGEDEWTPSAGTIVLTVEEGRDGGEARGGFFCRNLVKISEDTFKLAPIISPYSEIMVRIYDGEHGSGLCLDPTSEAKGKFGSQTKLHFDRGLDIRRCFRQ